MSEEIKVEQQITRSSIPRTVLEKYNKCTLPPNLVSMNPYMENGQDALKLYTNPNFFLDEWIQEQLRQREEAKKVIYRNLTEFQQYYLG